MKTNKHQTLLLVRDNKTIRSQHIVDEFNYSPGTARSYISHLTRQGLLERSGSGYSLTEKGQNRLQYFDVVGCGNLDCPFCQEKKSGYYNCPWCGFQLRGKEAKILQEWDFIFGVRHSGVYCPECEKRIFTAAQAKSIGIQEEK